MLTCQQLTELVTDYLEGKLPFRTRMRFQLHLGMCRHCRVHLGQMKTTIRVVGALPAEPIPAAIQQELLERFRDWHHAPRPG